MSHALTRGTGARCQWHRPTRSGRAALLPSRWQLRKARAVEERTERPDRVRPAAAAGVAAVVEVPVTQRAELLEALHGVVVLRVEAVAVVEEIALLGELLPCQDGAAGDAARSCLCRVRLIWKDLHAAWCMSACHPGPRAVGCTPTEGVNVRARSSLKRSRSGTEAQAEDVRGLLRGAGGARCGALTAPSHTGPADKCHASRRRRQVARHCGRIRHACTSCRTANRNTRCTALVALMLSQA